jgi:uncharacterized membrane protein
MGLKPFSVAGEALQFAMRRYETVLRTATLPLALLLVFNMAAAFGYLSVANDRIITFKDVANAGLSWAQTAQIASNAAAKGLTNSSAPIWTIYGASLLVNAILIASFMAPLIRYAGLGEKPAPGLIRVPFGADQFRFLLAGVLSTLIFLLVVYAPISIATFSILGFMTEAMKTPFASFPDPESLHTIEIVMGAKAFGMRWVHQYQIWGAAAAGVAAIVIALMILHVRPRKQDRTAGIGFLGRVLGVTAGVAAYLATAGFLYVLMVRLFSQLLMFFGLAPLKGAVTPDILSLVLFGAAAIAFAGFFSLQMYPYPAVAVCRRSMAIAGTLRVTRRHDLVRLALAFVLLGVVLYGAQFLLVWLGVNSAYNVIATIAFAVESYLRVFLGPDGAGWVLPFFGWVWAVIGIFITVLWTAFTYGVSAGLWGRLYRESER